MCFPRRWGASQHSVPVPPAGGFWGQCGPQCLRVTSIKETRVLTYQLPSVFGENYSQDINFQALLVCTLIHYLQYLEHAYTKIQVYLKVRLNWASGILSDNPQPIPWVSLLWIQQHLLLEKGRSIAISCGRKGCAGAAPSCCRAGCPGSASGGDACRQRQGLRWGRRLGEGRGKTSRQSEHRMPKARST